MTSADPTGEPAWAPLSRNVPEDLVHLAARCVAADGGMPLAADPGFLRRRWSAETFALRTPAGTLLAAGAVSRGPDGPIVTGLVAPEARGRGLGAQILDRGLAIATATPPPATASASPAGNAEPSRVVTAETESLTEAAAALFASRGFRQVFAEEVMCIDPRTSRPPAWPDGTSLTDWSAESAGRFHGAYESSFRERPGFPGEPAAEWIAEYDEDDEFRRAWSVLATLPDIGDAGFITAAVGWIVQVGVVPAARGRGIGAALIRESLSRMTAAGATEAWLNVNANNPGAAALYRRLGFADRGRRARFQR